MLLAMNQNTTVSLQPPLSAYLVRLCALLMLRCPSNWLLVLQCLTSYLYGMLGHLMEKNLLHRAFSVFLFNSKYELLLQVWKFPFLFCTCMIYFSILSSNFYLAPGKGLRFPVFGFDMFEMETHEVPSCSGSFLTLDLLLEVGFMP